MGKKSVLISSPMTCNVTIMSLVELRAGRFSAAKPGQSRTGSNLSLTDN
jgi:hypothetical protein